MDDLSTALQALLNDPQSMAQVQGLLRTMGSGSASAPSAPAVPAAPPADALTTVLTRAAPILSAAQQENDATRLLQALRPLLGPVRQQKLSEACRLLKLLHVLPLLRDSGILQNLL